MTDFITLLEGNLKNLLAIDETKPNKYLKVQLDSVNPADNDPNYTTETYDIVLRYSELKDNDSEREILVDDIRNIINYVKDGFSDSSSKIEFITCNVIRYDGTAEVIFKYNFTIFV